MKKILLASTALVGFAGAAAAAEITLSGYAEIGIAPTTPSPGSCRANVWPKANVPSGAGCWSFPAVVARHSLAAYKFCKKTSKASSGR